MGEGRGKQGGKGGKGRKLVGAWQAMVGSPDLVLLVKSHGGFPGKRHNLT